MSLSPWIPDSPPPPEEPLLGGPAWEAELAAKEPEWWALPEPSEWD